MSQILIRKATLEDSQDIWSWRNDPLTCEMSITPATVSWEAHCDWFEQSLQNPYRALYVGQEQHPQDSVPKVGMCRFDIHPEQRIAEVSINLNPGKRGQGLATPLLKEAIQIFLQANPIGLRATIKKQNIASIQCFTRCGFKQWSEDGAYYYYQR